MSTGTRVLVEKLTILGTAARRPSEALLLICAAAAATRILKTQNKNQICKKKQTVGKEGIQLHFFD